MIYTNFYVKSQEKLGAVLRPLKDHTICLPPSTTLETLVIDYGAIVAKRGALVNKGDFVQLVLDGTVCSCHVCIMFHSYYHRLLTEYWSYVV